MSADVSPPRVSLTAQREVAADSADHRVPWGTRRDNSRNRRFNQKLYALYPPTRALKILDLGCSGGGFVKDCIDDGQLAVGLEGSDYSKKFRRAEWATIPDFLFTCDITADFEVRLGTELLQFDIVTAWEVLEHIAQDDLKQLASNVSRHLSPGGLWIASVSPKDDTVGGVSLHATARSRHWWIDTFAALGFVHLEQFVEYFNTQFIRGPKQGATGSFHLALTRDASRVPQIPRQRLGVWMYDRWLMSRPQKTLARLLVGP